MIELKERVIFLNKIHLFNGLKEDKLAGIGEKFEEREVAAGTVIFERDDKPDGFYLIFKGRVKVSRSSGGKDEFLAWLTTGDYFGEEALFENHGRSATITALENSLLFFLTRKKFEELLRTHPKLKPNFLVAIESRKLARASKFKWLGPKEVIYFIARRHKLRLYQALVAPILSLVIPALLVIWGFLTGATTPYILAGTVLVGILGWATWNAIDWSNDYYIVTNQRVIWLEKVVFLYDSREEAPLSTILSVGVETDELGRAFDFGNVIVRTFVGKLEFDHINHPVQAADMIREYWERTKLVYVQAQKNAMKNAIRQKLGLPVEQAPKEELPPIVVEEQEATKVSLLRIAFSNMFKLRVQDGDTVTYRKHWAVFVIQAWKPMAAILGIIALIITRSWYLFRSPTKAFFEKNAAGVTIPDTITLTLLALILPLIGWFIWEYIDWKNDIFMVTNDEIIDIDRKPIGSEERRSAQIESILSTSYKRIGLIANFFNFGTVFITVGGTQLDFEDVMDPAGVQADINRRRMARNAKKSEDSAKVERERMAIWLAAYHQNIDSFNAPITAPKEEKKKEENNNGKSKDVEETQE